MVPLAVILAALLDHPTPRAARLFADLAAPRYAAREAAGRDLVALGRAAVPLLRRGLTHPDPEVRERSLRLLPAAEEEAVRQRVAAILRLPLAPPPADVPRLRAFLAVAGDSREARQLYVEMYVAHHDLLQRLDAAGARAGEVYWTYHAKLNAPPEAVAEDVGIDPGPTPTVPRRVASRADLLLFLLLTADPAVKAHPTRSDSYSAGYFHADVVRATFTGPAAGPARRLLFAWLKGPRQFASVVEEVDRVRDGFRAVGDLGMTEARETLLALARDKREWHVPRAAAMLALPHVGRPEDVAVLSPFVTDDYTIGAGPAGQVLLGDVALAACVRLRGEKPAAYGFGGDGAAEVLACGFRDTKDRAAARQKWAARVAAQGGKP